MELFEMKVEVVFASAAAADEVLQELAIEGWSVLEDVIERRAWIIGIFASVDDRETRWRELQGLVAEMTMGEPERRALGDRDWKDSYKAHFKAWRFGPLHWVPIWERETFALPAGESVLWLDPGMAFGTGNHETTRLCVERLVILAQSQALKGRVVDAGCGSGILALSAAKLGYRDVAGFDNDPEAVRVSEENAGLNDLSGRVRFFTGDLVSGLAGEQADVLMANILANVLVAFARELTGAVAPGGTLILSGILSAECAGVAEEFGRIAPAWPQQTRTMGEWSDVVLTRPR